MKRKTAKEILADSFLELAGQVSVDKITVKAIVENCGYSQATFYRQFKANPLRSSRCYTSNERGGGGDAGRCSSIRNSRF